MIDIFGNRRRYLNFKSFLLILWLLELTWLLTGNSSATSFCSFCSFPGIDKMVHFFLFFILQFLMFSWCKELILNQVIVFLASSLVSVVYVFSLEFFQINLSNRTFSWLDILAGVFGVLVGSLAAWLRLLRKNKIKPKLLLHACCAVCSCYVAEKLKDNYNVCLYFFNPNINNRAEYQKRLKEMKKVADKLDLRLIVGKYQHKSWLHKIEGLESEPEKGGRCLKCYYVRLGWTARLARKGGFSFFGSTLSVSPHKNYTSISSVGREVAKIRKVGFLDVDFKKDDGFKKTMDRAKKWNIYRQNYCGCEFSLKKTK